MKRLSIAFAAFAVTVGATGASLSYTPQGSAPYYWSDAAAWGGTEPTNDDNATISSATFTTSPLTVQGESSANASNLYVDIGTLYVAPNATLTAKKGAAGGISIAKSKNATGVVTNYGSVTAYNLDLGTYSSSKGTLAQFDNFGTLTIENCLRMQILGTPSLFYNHAGATVRKTGGNEYTFYFGVGGNSANKFNGIINEGDFFDNTLEIWMGLSSKAHSQNEIIVRGNGRFFAEQHVALGLGNSSLGIITLSDNGFLSGNAEWHLGGSYRDKRYTGAEGRIILNDSSIFAASNAVYLGQRENCIGLLSLNDSSKMIVPTKAIYAGNGVSSTGTITMAGNSRLEFGTGSLYLGCASNAIGTVIMGDNSNLKLGYALRIGHADNSVGIMTLTNSATAVIRDNVQIGYGSNSTGTLTLTNSATMDMQYYVYLGVNAGAKGIISLTGDAALYVTNSSFVVGYNGGGTGVLNVAENAQVHANDLFVGQTGVAGTTGFVKLSDSATLFSTNICVPRWGSQGIGTLEVGGNSVVTNVHVLRIAYNATSTTGVGQSGTVAMRGGSIFFDIDPENPSYIETGRYNPINLNGYVSTVKGRIRGWGKIAFSDPRTYVTEAEVPSGITHYGQVIADGEGVMRDLDFGRFGSLQYTTTDANPSGTNGWFAVNKGRLKLPRSLPNRSGYKCIGDCFSANVDLGGTSRRLANIFNYEFTGAELNHFVFSELYAIDRDDIPAGLGGRSADKVLAVWRIGYFSDGPEIDEPTHPVSFTSANLKFKFSPEGVDGLHGVYVYRHDGTANGKWMRTGGRAEPNKAMPIAATGNFEPSSENWNLGWFAIVGRTSPFGTFVNIR